MQQEERRQLRSSSDTEGILFTKEKQKPPTSIAAAASSVPPPLTLHKAVNHYSVGSTASICPDNFHFCRICRESDESTWDMELDSCGELIAPCLCNGTMKYVHEKCVQRWIEVSQSRKCELCQFEYEVFTHTKPMKEVRLQKV